MAEPTMEMELRYMDLDALPGAVRNPKAHDVETLRKGIRLRGFNDPIGINETTGRIVEGHGRVMALKEMRDANEDPPQRVVVRDGRWFVPVIRGISFATDEEAEAYLLEHNQLSMIAGWEDKALAEMLQDLQKTPDIDVLGWSDAAIEKLVKNELGGSTLEEDDVPDLPSTPVSREGDVWTLGDHVLYVGDCATVLPANVAKGSGNLVITDPPYGVDYVGGVSHDPRYAKRRKRDGLTIDSDGSEQKAIDLFAAVWPVVMDLSALGAAWYVCSPAGCTSHGFASVLIKCGWRQTLAWVKSAPVFGRSDYHYQHEPIFYGWKPGAAHHAVADRTQTSIWNIPRPKGRENPGHPTPKPVELYARAMRNSSERGDLVLEPFAGSGTAFIAAEHLGRRVRGSELSPHYADVIVQRWEQVSGKKAQRKTAAGSARSAGKKAARGDGRATGRPSRPAPSARA